MEKGLKSEYTTYYDRLLYHRNLNKPHYNLVRHWRTPGLTIKERFRKSYLEFALLYNGLKKIIIDIRKHGDLIKKQYGRSKIRQFLQQVYLHFILGVPWIFIYYRMYQLFKPERWKRVREFTYFNEPIERDFIVMSLPGVEEYEHEHDIFRDKVQFYKHCREHNLPTPEIYSELDLEDKAALTHESLILPEADIFIKKIDGACGVGTAKFLYRNQRYEDGKGDGCKTTDIIEYLYNSKPKSNKFIVQPVVENHADWKPFTSGAVATCRIVAGLSPKKRECVPISAVFRIPIGAAILDNYSQGGLVSPVNMETGELGTAMGYEPGNGSFEFDTHPDTGKKLNGTVLPHWKELIAFTKQVHNTFDFIFVGWDIAYTTRGFMVIEGNGMWGGDLNECAHNQPLISTEYALLFDRWMEHFAERDALHKSPRS